MSGSDLHLYPEERELLRGLPHAARLMYEAIRVRMDGASCVSGRAPGPRLSYRYLAEEIEVPAERGRRNSAEFKPSARVIEYGLELLTRVGLIARAGSEPMVYLLPVALQVSSARRNNRGSAGQISGAMSRGRKASNTKASDGICEGISGAREEAISGAPQRSDNSYSVVEPEGEGEYSRVAPTVAGALCARLRALGVGKLSTAHPRLLQALAMGITTEEFEDCVRKRVQAGHDPPSLPWLAEAVIGKRQDRQRQQAHGTASGGAGQKQSSSELAEAALRHGDALARERVAGRLRVIAGGRAPAGDPSRAVDADGWDLSTPLDLGPGRHA